MKSTGQIKSRFQPPESPKASLFGGLILLACFLSGCASDDKKIFLLSDSPKFHRAETSAAPLISPARISKTDETRIQRAIFCNLLERHFWDDNGFSAIFLQADEALETALIKKFPNHQPPIKPSYHANLRGNRTPIDRDTNKPAMVLSVDINEPNEDGSVTAIGRWYAGGAVTGFYAFTLKKNGDDWQIQTVN